jgi:hypothetical protein
MIFKKISGYFIGQVRPYGAKTWETVTGRCKLANLAIGKAARSMRQSDDRVRVVFVDSRGWPYTRTVVEVKRTELEGCRLERV